MAKLLELKEKSDTSRNFEEPDQVWNRVRQSLLDEQVAESKKQQ